MILSVRRQHRNKSVPVHEKRSFPKDCKEYTAYILLRQAFSDALLNLLKLDNNAKMILSPSTAISVHFLEKLEKTIGLRFGSDYRLFGGSLRFTT